MLQSMGSERVGHNCVTEMNHAQKHGALSLSFFFFLLKTMGLSSFDIFCFFGERESHEGGEAFLGKGHLNHSWGKGWEWVSHSKGATCWSVDMASGSTDVGIGGP